MIKKVITVLTRVGSASFVTIIGSMYDATGSYRLPVLMGIGIAVSIFVLVLCLAILAKKETAKAAEQKQKPLD